jgi:site-specific recombinase XerD
MRCVGCKHFRTDLTHLGALEKYLTDLLAARERILAASDELADWAEAGLDGMLTPHCLRHSYVTHLAELGWAARFIQDQVGHSHAATTAIYMSVGDDFKDRLVRTAIDEQLAQIGRG